MFVLFIVGLRELPGSLRDQMPELMEPVRQALTRQAESSVLWCNNINIFKMLVVTL